MDPFDPDLTLIFVLTTLSSDLIVTQLGRTCGCEQKYRALAVV